MDIFSLLRFSQFSLYLVLTEWLLRQPFPDGNKRQWWDGYCPWLLRHLQGKSLPACLSPTGDHRRENILTFLY